MAGIDGIGSVQENYEKYKDMFSDKQNDLITMESFYQLLVAEMQNQDPLEPTSNTEFISQMASFTALQSQQDANQTQIQSYANSLIGKTVTVSTPEGQVETGVVTSALSGETPKVTVNGKNYLLSSVSQVHSGASESTSTIGDYGAFATGLLGKSVTVQAFDSMGTSYIDEGVVDSLEIQNGNVRLIINGYAYDVTDVVRVKEAEVKQSAPIVNEQEPAQVLPTIQEVLQDVISDNEPDIEDILEEAEEAADAALLQLFE